MDEKKIKSIDIDTILEKMDTSINKYKETLKGYKDILLEKEAEIEKTLKNSTQEKLEALNDYGKQINTASEAALKDLKESFKNAYKDISEGLKKAKKEIKKIHKSQS